MVGSWVARWLLICLVHDIRPLVLIILVIVRDSPPGFSNDVVCSERLGTLDASCVVEYGDNAPCCEGSFMFGRTRYAYTCQVEGQQLI